jgi:hypothetical protein
MIVMTNGEKTRFDKHVAELFRAGWTDARIAEWAGSAASGFGRYFTAAEARPVVRAICKRLIGQQRAADAIIRAEERKIVRELRDQFPSFKKYFNVR